jgi:hypothetical protein
MGQDISADIAGQIGSAKVFGSSDNIRHGKYRLLIRRIFGELVETEHGNNRMAFWEFRVLKSEPNPQIEGDRDASGKLIDDGTKPNAVGSDCALKINFDGPGARSAGANIRQPIEALFNKQGGEVSDQEISNTWVDLARRQPVRKGAQIGFNQTTMQPIIATEDKNNNPACGMIIDCHTRAKKKKTPNDKGAYITKLIFTSAFPIGTGENSMELIAQRRAEIELSQSDDDDDTTAPPAPGVQAAPHAPAPSAPPPPPVAAAAPPPPAPWAPPSPWKIHPTAPGWFFSDPALGGNNAVKSEAQLKAGQ